VLLNTQLAVTRQQYDTQKAQVDQLAASVQADQAQIDAAELNVAYRGEARGTKPSRASCGKSPSEPGRGPIRNPVLAAGFIRILD